MGGNYYNKEVEFFCNECNRAFIVIINRESPVTHCPFCGADNIVEFGWVEESPLLPINGSTQFDNN